MQTLLDVITSVIISGMVMISMFTALLAIQAQSFNSQIYMTMENSKLKTVKIIKEYYLASLGVNGPSNPIVTATGKKFRFYSFIDPGTGIAASTDVAIEERTISGKKSIWVYANNNYSQMLYGPFDLSTRGLNFIYYDKDGNTPPSSISDIRSVELEINFVREGLNFRTSTPLFITNHIVIWKYFEKLYY